MGDILAVRGDEGRMLVSEISRGADKQAVIRGCPNRETLLLERVVTL
jgi:hypothetical protein